MGDQDGRPKRRKTITDSLKDVFTLRPELTIRLTKSRATDLQLSRPIFIEIDKLEYITFNSNSAAYLYYICSSLFEVPSAEFNIMYSLDGRLLDDDSDRWEMVEESDQILKGDYLLQFYDEVTPNFNFINVSSHVTTTDSPSTTPQNPINNVPPSTTSSTTDNPSPSSIRATNTPSSIARNNRLHRLVAMRDGGCVMTDVVEDMCINSRIIPRRLFNKQITVMECGFTFTSEYDPNICLLLEPNLDKCVDTFIGSICQQDNRFVWQIFRSNSRPEKRCFTSTAWEAAEKKEVARIPDSPGLRVALQWHFRQCLVQNWCTLEISERYFDEAWYLFGCDGETSISSFDTGYFSCSDSISESDY